MPKVSSATVDVSDRENEPVHIPGAIQPFGFLIAFALPTWRIAHVSANAAAVFSIESPTPMIEATMETVLPPKIIHDLRNVFQAAMISGLAERLSNVPVGTRQEVYDILIHASGQLAIAEFIPCAGADTTLGDATALVKTVINRLRRTTSFKTFLASAARQIRAVTGYDRVMLYKFLEDDTGVVVAEALRAGMTPFLDLHYPASDIPAQSRALFLRQWLRFIATVDYTPVPIIPPLTEKGSPVDLTLSTLRSASPIHLQHLRDMGSAATLTISIMRGDRLWGLIACHHDTPRRISATTSAAMELLAQVLSTQIEAKQQHDVLAEIARGREVHDRLIASMEPEETIFDNLRRFNTLIQDMIPCDGIGIWTNDRFEAEGVAPPNDAIPELIRFLNGKGANEVFSTDMLSRHLPDAARYAPAVSGLLAIPFPRAPRDYLLLFRREVIRTVTWGGNPNKAAEINGTIEGAGQPLSPRAGFAAWKETVRDRSMPWRDSETTIAETLRISLLDVILRRANIIDRERRVAQEGQILLVAELNHRVKNVLSVIRSLVRQSRQGATSLDTFTNDLQSRIHALSLAHDQLTLGHWKAAPLLTLIEAEAQVWTHVKDTRLALSGPSVMIEARAYQTLALVLHEMMTNAAKHGALSVEAGHLAITWSLEETGDLALMWEERGGPPVTPPKRRGFGTIVIEQSIPFELRGETSIEYRPEGIRARFVIPHDSVRKGGEETASRRPLLAAPQVDLKGKNLLLVEDSMMIALDAQTMLQNCGADVEIAATTSDARRALKLNAFDAAILDVNLYIETSFAVAEDLQDRAIPFVFATGYGETITVPDRFKTVHVISKPYTEDMLRAALAA